MNETGDYLHLENETASLVYPSARPFFDIAQYLSERGYAVLQYDKRGFGANMTILENNVWGNITVDYLTQDAQKALDLLTNQPEVDSGKISLIGHSEGTTIVPRIAINNSEKVASIVLMGTLAQNLEEIGKYQILVPVTYAHEILDGDHDGLILLTEASKDPVFLSLVGDVSLLLTQYNTPMNETVKRFDPRYEVNNDTFISIDDELKPRLLEKLKSFSVMTTGEKCNVLVAPCPIWLNSQLALAPNLEIIGNIPANISILIVQGENDADTPIQQALLLQQKLTELRHPDHSLITYQNLGHLFYPSSKWITPIGGPIEKEFLEDLFQWISDPLRELR